MSACPIPTPPGYTPCIKERGHAGLHDFLRLPDPRWLSPEMQAAMENERQNPPNEDEQMGAS